MKDTGTNSVEPSRTLGADQPSSGAPASGEGLATGARIRKIVEVALDARLSELEDRLKASLQPPLRTNALITERELAQMLRCNPRTVRRLETGGDLPAAIRVGGSKRWRLEAIEEWLNGLEQERRR